MLKLTVIIAAQRICIMLDRKQCHVGLLYSQPLATNHHDLSWLELEAKDV